MQNDKMELLKPGSLQHIGENMLAFLLHAASSPKFMKDAQQAKKESTEANKAIFFDVLVYMMIKSSLFAVFQILWLYHAFFYHYKLCNYT
jgi:hypothetical protein